MVETVESVSVASKEQNPTSDRDIQTSTTTRKGSEIQRFRVLRVRKNVACISLCAFTFFVVTILLIVAIILLLNRQVVIVNITSKEKNFQNEVQSTDTPPISLTASAVPLNSNFGLDRSTNLLKNSSNSLEVPLAPNNNTFTGKLKLVSRLEWLAQPPIETTNPLSLPVPYIVIHHTSTENCSSQVQCVLHVRFIQSFHIESRNWWDIGYSFLVGGDGAAYEGRGWKSEGAHTYGYNGKSIGIAFIGTFSSFKPPQKQIEACKKLIAKGVELGYVTHDYKLLAARQLQTTQSPGTILYEEIKTWDHWSSTP